MHVHGGHGKRSPWWRALAMLAAIVAMLAWAPPGRAPLAFAQGGPDGGAGHGGGQSGPSGAGSDSGRAGTGTRERGIDAGPVPLAGPVETAAPQERSVFVAQVRFAENGIVVVDGGTVTSGSAWSAFLAPGMWVRAEGTWRGTDFQASTLAVTSPGAFCFYLGPAEPLDGGDGWTEAWFVADPSRSGSAFGAAPLARRASVPRDEALWLGWWTGDTWAGAPASVTPAAPPQGGWWLARGTLETTGPSGSTAIRWRAPTPFPP